MKYVFQFGRILIVCFIGEVLSLVLPFPIPASVYGLILMLLALTFNIYRLDQVKETGQFFVGILTMLFVPAAVGIMDQWQELKSMLFACILATVLITLIVMGVSGKFTQWVHRLITNGRRKNNE